MKFIDEYTDADGRAVNMLCNIVLGVPQEIAAMDECPQDPEWHPEGNVLTHTLLVVDAVRTICDREGITGIDRDVMELAALCHDMGKPSTTKYNEAGRLVAHGHDEAGVPIAREYLTKGGCSQEVIDRVLPLVRYHMAHHRSSHSKRAVRRLIKKLAPATLRELALLVEADNTGRPPLPVDMTSMNDLLRVAKELED